MSLRMSSKRTALRQSNAISRRGQPVMGEVGDSAKGVLHSCQSEQPEPTRLRPVPQTKVSTNEAAIEVASETSNENASDEIVRIANVRGEKVSDLVRPILCAMLNGRGSSDAPLCFRFWDGTVLGSDDAKGVVEFHSSDALRRILWSPNELGVARAFVTGDIEIHGDLPSVLRALQKLASNEMHFGLRSIASLIGAAARTGAIGRPLPRPQEEVIPRGPMHSRERDKRVVRHHYDVSNDFYRLLLGPSWTYSCARFVSPRATLEDAQNDKHDLICRKLGLHERRSMRLLDVGCGWGSMAIHAATHYGATVVGVTLSAQQAAIATMRVQEAGLESSIDIRLQDHRDIGLERFDAISSIGMYEHVGRREALRYFANLRRLLVDGGRLLNHAISSANGSRTAKNTFMARYVFPDGELINVGDTVLAMQRAGFELRDTESLREHYVQTLRSWLRNIEDHEEEATHIVGANRVRIWRLYMSGCINGFQDGGLSVHQVLGVVPDATGGSQMPRSRREWER
jgi:cyclopropane-fatty-acyl-phospholipid synthase